MNRSEAELIAELELLGIKHNREKMLRIGKLASGKIVFLEQGKSGKTGSGLEHIIERHQDDFAKRGISQNEIADAVITAVTIGTVVGYQGTTEPRREIYQVIFNGKRQCIAVTVADNGYIVGANPAS